MVCKSVSYVVVVVAALVYCPFFDLFRFTYPIIKLVLLHALVLSECEMHDSGTRICVSIFSSLIIRTITVNREITLKTMKQFSDANVSNATAATTTTTNFPAHYLLTLIYLSYNAMRAENNCRDLREPISRFNSMLISNIDTQWNLCRKFRLYFFSLFHWLFGVYLCLDCCFMKSCACLKTKITLAFFSSSNKILFKYTTSIRNCHKNDLIFAKQIFNCKLTNLFSSSFLLQNIRAIQML